MQKQPPNVASNYKKKVGSEPTLTMEEWNPVVMVQFVEASIQCLATNKTYKMLAIIR